jgi:alpha-amylase
MAANQPNHTAVGTGNSTATPDTRSYPAVPYTVSNFHPLCSIDNYSDPYQVRNCELVGLHDLNQTIEDTRSKIVGFLNHLIELGVAGFRVDAAKHQWPNDLEVMYNRLNFLNTSFGFEAKSNPFIYQEVIDTGNEGVSKYEYSFAPVSEFRYMSEIARSFTGNDDLKWLSGFGEKWDLLPSKLAVVFVSNHDSQRNSGTLTYKMRRNYIMAQAFSLAHPYGQKRIMSSFDFETTAQGPPSDENENILSPVIDSTGNCTNGWICEHRWREIAGMVEFMNVVGGENVTSWWDNGKNQIAFSRGSKGFIAFNLENEDMKEVPIQTDLLSGSYCNVIDGEKISNSECSGRILKVSEDGIVLIDLSQTNVVAIHVGQKLMK